MQRLRTLERGITCQRSIETFPWESEGLIVDIKSGLEALKCAWIRSSNEWVLLLNDTPLVKIQSLCETCANFLAGGYGKENVSYETIEALRSASMRFNDALDEIAADIVPFLRLLGNGRYLVSFVPHYPTDGNQNFFWKDRITYEENNLLRDCVDVAGYIAAYPKCLISTQSFQMYNYERVAYYRNQIRSGARLGGIAFYVKGFVSALLDGHHRATAALLEEREFRCLTIIPKQSIMSTQYFIDATTITMKGNQHTPEPCNGKGFEYQDEIEAKAARYPNPGSVLWEEVTGNKKYRGIGQKFWKSVSKDKAVCNWRDF